MLVLLIYSELLSFSSMSPSYSYSTLVHSAVATFSISILLSYLSSHTSEFALCVLIINHFTEDALLPANIPCNTLAVYLLYKPLEYIVSLLLYDIL